MTLCRTLAEAFAAGVVAGAMLPPPTAEQVARVALILAPFIQDTAPESETSEAPQVAEPYTDAGQCWAAQDLMARLKISREKLRKLIHSGEVDAFKIGDGATSDLRITEESIHDFIKRHAVRHRRLGRPRHRERLSARRRTGHGHTLTGHSPCPGRPRRSQGCGGSSSYGGSPAASISACRCRKPVDEPDAADVHLSRR
jgi:hypothetical protein